ncbi:MAG: urease accessory protein UreF [Rhodospirillales bacterium]|nr:urease accessory protein UreF [Rhodospirillales bacterium]MDE2197595.1 urease accessory protein UreF [Rhodospirillales bacterium]
MPAATRTATTTMTTTTTEAALLRLLTWLSPAFPTGGYAYSHGLEWAVEQREIVDGASLQAWLDAILRHGAGRSDAILLRHAHRAAHDADALAGIAELACAIAPSRERLGEAVGQGNAFVAAAAAWRPEVLIRLAAQVGDIAYPVAVGALARTSAIPEDGACLAYLQGFTANLVSAAVRLVPLGQSAGLAVLALLEPTIIAVAEASRGVPLDDLGTACFRADLAAMHHETQYTRLFRS